MYPPVDSNVEKMFLYFGGTDQTFVRMLFRVSTSLRHKNARKSLKTESEMNLKTPGRTKWFEGIVAPDQTAKLTHSRGSIFEQG